MKDTAQDAERVLRALTAQISDAGGGLERQQSGLVPEGPAGRAVRRTASQKPELGPAPPPRSASGFKDKLTAGRSTAELNSTFGRCACWWPILDHHLPSSSQRLHF